MRVGVGLPSGIPRTAPETVVEWARAADEGPFSSVGVVDRLRYDCYEPLTTLAVAAACTERVGLVTMVVVAPMRNHAVLAKEAATLSRASHGRLTLGVAVGARVEDFRAAGIPHTARGDRLEDQLEDMRALWEQDGLAAGGAGWAGPPVVVGGISDVPFRRRLRARWWASSYVRTSGSQGAQRVGRSRPLRHPSVVGPGVLRSGRRRRHRARARVRARLLRVHRAFRREDRRGHARHPTSDRAICARLPGSRVRRARAPSIRRYS
jgi:alkanesulfonate monooxygenase SsuD/methylene tetrahydromethanopterin reductase-like flavin-dependent oxidoreductase (luciferase family)